MRPHRIWSSQAPGICKWRTLAANEWSSLPGTSKRATNSERSYCPQVNQLTNQSNLLLKCSDRPSHLIRCVENEFASFGFNLCPSQAFHLVFETLWKSSIYPHFRKKLNRWLVNFKNELGQCSTQFHTNEDLWIAYHVRPDTSIIVINHHNWRGLKHLISLTLVQTPLPQYFQTFWPYPQSSHVQKISFYQLWDASRESSSNQFQRLDVLPNATVKLFNVFNRAWVLLLYHTLQVSVELPVGIGGCPSKKHNKRVTPVVWICPPALWTPNN